MNERDKRNQSYWNDRNERSDRDRHDQSDRSRQQSQWRDDDYFSESNQSSGRSYGDDSYGRGRGTQGGGSYASYSNRYSGDRSSDDRYSRDRDRWSEDDRSRQYGSGGSDYSRSDRFGQDYEHSDPARSGYGGGRYGSRYDTSPDSNFRSFTSEDQGGRDFVAGGAGSSRGYGRRSTFSGYGSGSRDYGYGGAVDYGSGSDYGSRDYGAGSRGYSGRSRDYRSSDQYGDRRGQDEDRGFFQRAGDEIASWFGDEEAARRREMDHRGRGPSGYTRSDERIREDANDALTNDWSVDATNINVRVENGEMTLDGTVDSRQAKRRAEDCVERVSGVRHVQNNLRVSDPRTRSSSYGTSSHESSSSGSQTSSGTTTATTGTGTTALSGGTPAPSSSTTGSSTSATKSS